MGPDDAWRRELRRSLLVLQTQRCRARGPRLRLLPSDSPRPGGRERPLLGPHRRGLGGGGQGSAGQRPLRYHQRPYRVPEGPRDRLHHRRVPRSPLGLSLQGKRGSRQARGGVRRRAGPSPALHRHRHLQFLRGPAGVDGDIRAVSGLCRAHGVPFSSTPRASRRIPTS